MHTLAAHVTAVACASVVVHSLPQAPQFLGSTVVSVQLPLHAVGVPVGQAHLPAEQTSWLTGQAVPHVVPQLF